MLGNRTVATDIEMITYSKINFNYYLKREVGIVNSGNQRTFCFPKGTNVY